LSISSQCALTDAKLTFHNNAGACAADRVKNTVECTARLDQLCYKASDTSCAAPAGGYQCGAQTGADDTWSCPVLEDGDANFTADVTISTSDACPEFGMGSTACGVMETQKADGSALTEFQQGDVVRLHFEIGTKNSEKGDGMKMESWTATVGTTSNAAGACWFGSPTKTDHCANSYTKTTTACARQGAAAAYQATLADASKCDIQCDHHLDIPLTNALYDLSPVPPQAGGETTILFTGKITVKYADIARKTTLDISTSKSSMYALLQQQEPDNVLVATTVGFTHPGEQAEVEGVQQAETESVQPAMAIEESSSNLVYIVVGVLLVLSVGIAAVVMYMRRSKNAKKVVPVPITVEVRNTSSTN